MPEKKQLVDIGGYKLKVSNLDKVLYPNAKIVKAEIIQYYIKIAKWMLPFAINRPISMLRFPDGIIAHQFYSKNAPTWKPDWMQTYQLAGDDNNYIIIQGTQDLVWLANIASLEIHAMNKRVSHQLEMDHIIFDFDPPSKFSYEELRDLTVQIGDFLREKGYSPYVKTSGSRGSHIYLPITPSINYDLVIKEIKLLAKAIAIAFSEQTTTALRKEARKGKILIDINRNYEAQTTILPFSTRARPSAPISMPLFWEDFKKTNSSQDFNINNAFEYLELKGNAWSDFHDNANTVQVKIKESIPKERKTEQEKSQAPSWFLKPDCQHMLANQTLKFIESDHLIYENKWDGIRVFIYIWKSKAKIMSRSGRDISHLFPELISFSHNSRSVILDGEIVVPDEQGKPIFARVISRMHSKSAIAKQMKSNPAIFYAFDILQTEEKNICQLPWKKRRQILSDSILSFPKYKLSSATDEGTFLFDAAYKLDLEGIMIKNAKSPYLQGERSDYWLKLKFRLEAECVILGYTAGDGDRSSFFGSLHLAEVVGNQLLYRGRVGTGFDKHSLKAYKKFFDQLKKGEQFIDGKVEERNKTTWFAEKLPICEIQYARLTETGTFREPVFKKMEERLYDI